MMGRRLPLLLLLLSASAFAHVPERNLFSHSDPANRLTNTLTPLLRKTRLTYNDRGLPATITEPSQQSTVLTYDPRGRLQTRTDGVATNTTNVYDGNNNLLTVTENGKTKTRSYDAYDRVVSYSDGEGNTLGYRYDPGGNLTELIYPDTNKWVKYDYDSHNRLTNVLDWAGRRTRLEYDLAGRLTRLVRPNLTVREIRYDAAGQTTNIFERTGTGGGIAYFKLNWNSAERVEWEFAAPKPQPWTPPTRTMTYDDDNRLATFNGSNVVHDLDGNQTSGPLSNGLFVAHAYDARNRLTSVGSAGSLPALGYHYDCEGQRIAVVTGSQTNRFAVNPHAALSQVLVRSNTTSQTLYVYGVGLLYEVDASGNAKYYHYDYRGSTVAITDQSGNITDRVEYSPYGATTHRVGTTDTPFLYNGRYGVQTDPNGLLYMRARYYSPHLCRFLTEDPAGFAAGLNFFAAFDGNPVSLMDPFGLGADSIEGNASWINRAYNAHTCVDCHWSPEILQAGILPQDTPWFNAQGSETATKAYLGGVAVLSAGTLGAAYAPELLAAVLSHPVETAVYGTIAVETAVVVGTGYQGPSPAGGFNFSGLTKSGARAAAQGMGLPRSQTAGVTSAISRATGTSVVKVNQYGSDVVVQIIRPGQNGYQIIESVVTVNGNKTVVQKAYDSSGKLVHFDPKH